MFQRILAWAVLLMLLGLLAHGLLTGGLFAQSVWAPAGWHRFLLVAALYGGLSGLLIWRAPGAWLPVLAASALLYSMAAVGIGPPLALGYFGLSAYSTGAIWFRRFPDFARRAPQLAVSVGLGTWIGFVMLLSGVPLHYRALYWLLAAVPIVVALRFQFIPSFRPSYPKSRGDVAAFAVGVFPLFCHWLVALKPEVSADGLAMHMVIPARLLNLHRWEYDVHEFAWAVMPMGGDWLYSIGWLLAGEACARLLNWGLLALLVWTLYERLHARVPGWMTALLLAAFTSTPLTQLVTGSLFVENVTAVLLLGAVLLLRVYVKERRGVFFYACALLAGLAVATKVGALAFVLPLAVAAVVQVRFGHLMLGLPVTLAAAAPPYVVAWWRADNPLFPFFNAWFRSTLFDTTANFRDMRFDSALTVSTWYDLTFHSGRFIEGADGAFGFFFFLFVPLAVVGWRRRWPKTGTVLIWVTVVGTVLSYLGQSNLRYLYPALPLYTLLIGIAAASYRMHDVWLGRVLGGLAGATALLNLALLPAAGSSHGDFALNQVFDRKTVDTYVTTRAPERQLVNWLNTNDPEARVAWVEGNAIGDFRGQSFSNTWHSRFFQRRLAESTAPEGHAWLARDLRIGYVIAPAPDSSRSVTNVFTREFLEGYTERVLVSGDMELRRFHAPDPSSPGPPIRYAPPGRFDDDSGFIHFSGRWRRDNQLKQAYRGTLVYSNDTRSRVTIRFRGRSIRLLYTAAANRCPALLSIDDQAEVAFDENAAATTWQALSPAFAAPGVRDHVLQMRFPQGVAKTATAGCFLDLDGFVVD